MLKKAGLAGLALAVLVVGGIALTYVIPVSVAVGPCLKDWTSPSSYGRRASPLASTALPLGDGAVKVCYGRPSARGRLVYGFLIPHGRLWRFGANEPTRLFTSVPLDVAGVAVEPGRYSLYVIPEAEQWTVAVNRSTFHWGLDFSEAVLAREVGRGVVPVRTTPGYVETFALTLVPTEPGRANLVADWERTRVEIPIALRPR